MATLEERIQNLTQQVNPMGSGVMSDQDVERVMPYVPSVDRVFKMMDETLEPNISVEKRISNLRKLERIKNIPEYKGFGFLDGFRERVLGAGVMTDLDAQRVMQALDGNMGSGVMSNQDVDLINNLRNQTVGPGVMTDLDAQRVMDATPELSGSMASSPMQPLVDLGFGEQVNIILSNPADSQISRDAQQVIINELGTGMDIDGFLMEVQKLAPKGEMSNQGVMSNQDMQGIMSMMGRDGDTALGHLTEGEVVIPAPVLEANPQASDMLENTMMDMGIDPRTRVVDSTGELGGIASINPNTGLQEFGFLSKIFKKVKNVVKKAAPIVGALAIPGVGGVLTKGLSAAGSALGIPSGIGKSFLGGKGILDRATAIRGGISNLIRPKKEGQSAIGTIEDIIKGRKSDEIREGGNILDIFDNQQIQTDPEGNIIRQAGMSTGGKFALAGLAGLLGKLAYEEQKKQKGVPLTPLTTMDALGRYNIASEIARRTNEEMPSRVEFGLTAEGLPALSGGMPRNARDGGIMAFAQGGAVAMQEGGEPPIDMADFPRKNGEIDGPGTGTSDDIPAMLSDGEFVMTAKAVRNAGSYDMSSNNGIVTLSPNGGSDREAGTRIMYKLMNHFENLA